MIGTLVGAVAIVVLTACFPQERAAFLIGLALWGAWPNGAFAITFTAIVVTLLAPTADAAYAFAFRFAVGIVLGSVGAAIIEFAALPKVETFTGFRRPSTAS